MLLYAERVKVCPKFIAPIINATRRNIVDVILSV